MNWELGLRRLRMFLGILWSFVVVVSIVATVFIEDDFDWYLIPAVLGIVAAGWFVLWFILTPLVKLIVWVKKGFKGE